MLYLYTRLTMLAFSVRVREIFLPTMTEHSSGRPIPPPTFYENVHITYSTTIRVYVLCMTLQRLMNNHENNFEQLWILRYSTCNTGPEQRVAA